MDLLTKLQELVVIIAALQEQLGDFPKALEDTKTAALAEGKAIGFEEGKVAGYAIGFEDGKNSVPVGGGFTQEQVDAMIAEAVEPLKKNLAEKELELAAVKESIPTLVNEQVQIAITALKADLFAKFQKAQEEETALEGAYQELLK